MHIGVLDIGTSKICCAIGTTGAEKHRVLGLGYHGARGIKRGRIVHFEAVEESILHAIHAAEEKSEKSLKSVYVNVPASVGKSHFIEHSIELSDPLVSDGPIYRLLSLDSNRFQNEHILHVFPLSYTLDGVSGIRDPKGMLGKVLSARLHVITTSKSYIRNLSQVIGRCHLDIKGFVFSPYATALSSLTEDEMEIGVTLIEMGGGYTSVSSFQEGNLISFFYIPLGGENVTKDIAQGLHTSLSQAERLKTLHGSIMEFGERDHLFLPTLSNEEQTFQQVPKSALSHIIRARIEEIFDLILGRLKENQRASSQRLVITGGGAQLQGIKEFISYLWQAPVRIAKPDISGHSSGFSTLMGLLEYGIKDYGHNQWLSVLSRQPSKLEKLFVKAQNWLKKNFGTSS